MRASCRFILTSGTIKAFLLLDDMEYPEEDFDEYVRFKQLDTFLCRLEAWSS